MLCDVCDPTVLFEPTVFFDACVVFDIDLDIRVLRRISLCGRNMSKRGRNRGQQVTMIPVLIRAIAHINVVARLYVTSP